MDLPFWLVIAAIVVAVAYFVSRKRDKGGSTRPTHESSRQPPRPANNAPQTRTTPNSVSRPSSSTITWQPTTTSSSRPAKTTHTFRPTSSSGTISTVNFQTPALGSTQPIDIDTADLVDALTGVALHTHTALFQCTTCQVFYQQASYDLLVEQNHRRCVSCLQTTIVRVSSSAKRTGRNADISRITLENYRKHVGHVITFEGKVHTVLISRRGTDYAVMFEQATWTKGFKMVVFQRNVDDVGGERFIMQLPGRYLKVRGLLVNDDIFGYEIIVNDRSMILDIR